MPHSFADFSESTKAMIDVTEAVIPVCMQGYTLCIYREEV